MQSAVIVEFLNVAALAQVAISSKQNSKTE